MKSPFAVLITLFMDLVLTCPHACICYCTVLLYYFSWFPLLWHECHLPLFLCLLLFPLVLTLMLHPNAPTLSKMKFKFKAKALLSHVSTIHCLNQVMLISSLSTLSSLISISNGNSIFWGCSWQICAVTQKSLQRR